MKHEAAAETAPIDPARERPRPAGVRAPFVDRVDRYELQRPLGKGGFATVYEAYDPRIKRRVAVKRCSSLDESNHERFFREAEIAGNLSHANIVRIFDFGVADGIPFIVQELLDGKDLADWIVAGLQLSNHDRVRILLQVARGLAYAHSRNVIHRDVKPANIRVLEDGSIKLMDFGVAAIQEAPSHLTETGMTVGTAAYLAPEQIRGESPNRATDIFAFGVVAYELLSGHRPFDGETLSAVLYQVAHHPADRLRSESLPGSIINLVHRCLDKHKKNRPESFDEIEEALEAALRDPRLKPPAADTVPIAIPSTASPARSDLGHGRTSFGATASPTANPGLQSSSQAAQRPKPRRRPVRDSSARIQVARPRRRAVWPLVFGLLAAAASVGYVQAGGPLPEPASAALDRTQSWIAERLMDWKPLLEPSVPAAAPVGVPFSQAPLVSATPAPGVTASSMPETGLDPVSAAIEVLATKNRTPDPRRARQDSARLRPVSPNARATVFLPPGWHPRMQVAVDGGAFQTLDSRRTHELRPGAHSVRFRLETSTYITSKTLDIRLEPAETRTIESPLAPPAALSVRLVPDALSGRVEIDGRFFEVPIEEALLAPGRHTLVFYPAPKDPLGPLTKTVVLEPSSLHQTTFDMRRRRATVEVLEPFEWSGE